MVAPTSQAAPQRDAPTASVNKLPRSSNVAPSSNPTPSTQTTTVASKKNVTDKMAKNINEALECASAKMLRVDGSKTYYKSDPQLTVHASISMASLALIQVVELCRTIFMK